MGNNDGVHSAGSLSESFALVAMRVVLVLVHLAAVILALPGHGAFAHAHVALGGDGRGLSAEVPARRLVSIHFTPLHSSPLVHGAWGPRVRFRDFGSRGEGEGRYLPSSDQESTGHDSEKDLESVRQVVVQLPGVTGLYIELGITSGTLVEVGFLDLGRVEAARGRAEERSAGEGPAGGHGSD